MQRIKKSPVLFMTVAFIIGALVGIGAYIGISHGLLGYRTVSGSEYREVTQTYERFGKLNEINDAIDTSYYKDVDEESLTDGACKGLVAGLGDPYSEYMTADEFDSWMASTVGNYSGVGITFTQDKDENYIVVSTEKDSPARRAGIKKDDIILKVDGREYDTMDLLGNAIRGEEGTDVELTYSRDGKEKTVTLTREEITQHSVSSEMLDNDIGYIEISSFIESTGDDFKAALEKLEKNGARGLILDLRDNGGGIVSECIAVADEFIDEGPIVSTKGRNGEKTDYDSEDGKTDLKTVVLVNENSASSSEILAAALQDNGIKLVGQKTYGKGVIQNTAAFKDGSALKLTIAEYFSPDGDSINKKGIVPDYKVRYDGSGSGDTQLEKALSLFPAS